MIDHEGECRRTIRWLLLSLLVVVGGGCKAQEEKIGVGITGIDHLADHLSVQEFSVDGYRAGRAGGGGGTVCCAMLPAKWRPGLSVEIRWNVTNWRDCDGQEFVRQVPVEKYDEIGTLWVHFLTNGNVRVIVSNPGPGNPKYMGPHDSIPRKRPWQEYSLDESCKRKEELEKKS
ncbi:DUF3304 domain-containing protein [Xanthomonas massiliensis]|uniref:DUF3304 domain-containing protein n=1 Tax=Xanthomonas massiliensis TaxID=1720302 RepID=UPI000826A166|nr:DUF3304 domain-containing protein [Xanthomonas massiliensis]